MFHNVLCVSTHNLKVILFNIFNSVNYAMNSCSVINAFWPTLEIMLCHVNDNSGFWSILVSEFLMRGNQPVYLNVFIKLMGDRSINCCSLHVQRKYALGQTGKAGVYLLCLYASYSCPLMEDAALDWPALARLANRYWAYT